MRARSRGKAFAASSLGAAASDRRWRARCSRRPGRPRGRPGRDAVDLAALFRHARVYLRRSGRCRRSLVGTRGPAAGPTCPIENAPYPGTPSRTLRVPMAAHPRRRGCAAATGVPLRDSAPRLTAVASFWRSRGARLRAPARAPREPRARPQLDGRSRHGTLASRPARRLQRGAITLHVPRTRAVARGAPCSTRSFRWRPRPCLRALAEKGSPAPPCCFDSACVFPDRSSRLVDSGAGVPLIVATRAACAAPFAPARGRAERRRSPWSYRPHVVWDCRGGRLHSAAHYPDSSSAD